MQYSTVLEQLGSIYSKRILPVHIIINGQGFLKFVIIYSKRIFPVHIITNNLQMAYKLLHVLFPYNVSKITQDLNKTVFILKALSGPVAAVYHLFYPVIVPVLYCHTYVSALVHNIFSSTSPVICRRILRAVFCRGWVKYHGNPGRSLLEHLYSRGNMPESKL